MTIDEYARFVGERVYGAGDWRAPGFSQSSNDPVVMVSWDDAQAYVGWLSQKTGHRYRLLSEAEYEYAERAGTMTAYWWGNDRDEVCSYANGLVASTTARSRSGAILIMRLVGNVWEWTEDGYHGSYDGAPDDGSAWTNADCHIRVLRGGSWYNGTLYLRSANRNRNDVGDR